MSLLVHPKCPEQLRPIEDDDEDENEMGLCKERVCKTVC